MSITTTNRSSRRLGALVVPAAAIGVLALAGCGGSGGGTSSNGAAGSAGSAGTTTVTVRDASGHGGVLATAAGRTLYASDQEAGKVLCKSSACTAIWMPLTVAAGQTPSGPSQLTGKLSTVQRPDGKAQVALDGKPLYRFSFDHSPGQVAGDGQKDSFDGTDFTWHTATVSAGAPATSAPASSAPSSSTSGGYNY